MLAFVLTTGVLAGVLVALALVTNREAKAGGGDPADAEEPLDESESSEEQLAADADATMELLRALPGASAEVLEAALTQRMLKNMEYFSATVPHLDLHAARVLIRRHDSLELEVRLRKGGTEHLSGGRVRLRLLKDEMGWKLDHIRVAPEGSRR